MPSSNSVAPFLILLLGFPVSNHALALPVIDTIAFGSCLRQGDDQPIWNAIIAAQPDLFLFMGDNVYADTEDMDLMRASYSEVASQGGFQQLRAICPILATWDDHDYGGNDAGAEYPMKHQSRQIFLEFFNTPTNSPVWAREGVYDAHIYGHGDRRTQIILLDTRFFRSPLKPGPSNARCRRINYVPNEDQTTTLLGSAQWDWLAEQLRRPAELRILVSSIQVIPNQHCFEKWGNLPHERNRLFRLIHDTNANGVVFISGDRHLAEISRMTDSPVDYPLYEVTSSGLNSAGAGYGEQNRYRLTADNFRSDNFGLITVDWHQPNPRITLQVANESGAIVFRHGIRLSELQSRR